jgi:hypothetical protein
MPTPAARATASRLASAPPALKTALGRLKDTLAIASGIGARLSRALVPRPVNARLYYFAVG